MLVKEEGLATLRRSLCGSELLDDLERSRHVLGSLVVERREPLCEGVGREELEHVEQYAFVGIMLSSA